MIIVGRIIDGRSGEETRNENAFERLASTLLITTAYWKPFIVAHSVPHPNEMQFNFLRRRDQPDF